MVYRRRFISTYKRVQVDVQEYCASASVGSPTEGDGPRKVFHIMSTHPVHFREFMSTVRRSDLDFLFTKELHRTRRI